MDPYQDTLITQVPGWITSIIFVIGCIAGVVADKTEPQEDQTDQEEPFFYGNKVLRGDRIIWPKS